jgi:hypothetical protein
MNRCNRLQKWFSSISFAGLFGLLIGACERQPEIRDLSTAEQTPQLEPDKSGNNSHEPQPKVEIQAPAYKGLGGDVFIKTEIIVDDAKCVQILGKTNLPPSTKLRVDVRENRPDVVLAPGDSIAVQSDGTFKTRLIKHQGGGFPDGRYVAKISMSIHVFQPKEVQGYFGESGKLLTGPLVGQTSEIGKFVQCTQEFVVGQPNDKQVAMELAQEKDTIMKWVRNVSEYKAQLANSPLAATFRQHRKQIESLETAYLAEAGAIRQVHFRAAIASVFADLRVMAGASSNSEFDLQYQEFRNSIDYLEKCVKDAGYDN